MIFAGKIVGNDADTMRRMFLMASAGFFVMLLMTRSMPRDDTGVASRRIASIACCSATAVCALLLWAFAFQVGISFIFSFLSIHIRNLGLSTTYIGYAMCISAVSELPVLLIIDRVLKKRLSRTTVVVRGSRAGRPPGADLGRDRFYRHRARSGLPRCQFYDRILLQYAAGQSRSAFRTQSQRSGIARAGAVGNGVDPEFGRGRLAVRPPVDPFRDAVGRDLCVGTGVNGDSGVSFPPSDSFSLRQPKLYPLCPQTHLDNLCLPGARPTVIRYSVRSGAGSYRSGRVSAQVRSNACCRS